MTTIRGNEAPVHPEISSLLPWYVNGSISASERQHVDEHLTLCTHCRDELARERWIYQNMTAENAVEHMPSASLQRLQARLDGVDGAERAPDAPAAAAKPRDRSMPWPGLMAASVAVLAVALSLLAAGRWTQYGARAGAPVYHVTTTPVPRVPNAAIRAVFSPTITLSELQSMLDEAQLRIVSGPSEAGVYSLAVNSDRPVSVSLAMLRQHAAVRFAESTDSARPSSGAGDSP
ncbi:MAG TPA: zf-HC2 domain-containing protein [Steroidobacteraceae bacterium]|jgi:anti-sigma factor RsiW|nr:zf-HC2 domain-containing protein [Steroidobacteraceae bacterium]